MIPCNVYLRQIRVKNSDICDYCGGMDDLYHFFYGCEHTPPFWAGLGKWLRSNSAIVALSRSISELEFILGIIDTDDIDFRVNFILLLGKFYIYRQKIFAQGALDPYQFLVELKSVLTIERMACIREGKLQKKFSKWQAFYDEL